VSGGWRQKVVHEMVEYALNFVYLAFFLVAFTWYRRLILAAYAIGYSDYWVPLVEAAVLAKVIMVGDMMRLGRGLERAPLLVPTLYRTVVFAGLVGVFSVLEHTGRGLLQGKGLSEGVAALASKGRYEVLAQCVVIACAFVPFFAFKELEVVVGKDGLRDMFWRRATPEPGARRPGEVADEEA
jgi:hypothetical protein